MDRQQPFGAIQAEGIAGYASAWLPMGCNQMLALWLPGDSHEAARDAIAHNPRTTCGSRRTFTGVSP